MTKCKRCGIVFDRLNQGEYADAGFEDICTSCIGQEYGVEECMNCDGNGCPICSNTGWIRTGEMAPSILGGSLDE